MEFVALGVRFEDGKIADPVIAQAIERALGKDEREVPEKIAA